MQLRHMFSKQTKIKSLLDVHIKDLHPSKPEIETAARTLLRLQLVTHGNWVAPVSQSLHELQPDRARFSGRLQLYPTSTAEIKSLILKGDKNAAASCYSSWGRSKVLWAGN